MSTSDTYKETLEKEKPFESYFVELMRDDTVVRDHSLGLQENEHFSLFGYVEGEGGTELGSFDFDEYAIETYELMTGGSIPLFIRGDRYTDDVSEINQFKSYVIGLVGVYENEDRLEYRLLDDISSEAIQNHWTVFGVNDRNELWNIGDFISKRAALKVLFKIDQFNSPFVVKGPEDDPLDHPTR